MPSAAAILIAAGLGVATIGVVGIVHGVNKAAHTVAHTVSRVVKHGVKPAPKPDTSAPVR